MAGSAFQQGSVVRATSIDDEKSFAVTVTSPTAISHGSTSAIFLGSTASEAAGSPNVPVALKVLVNIVGQEQQSDTAQLIRRELRAARRVQHPLILSYIGIATIDFYTVLISPYMANGNLLQYLRRYPKAERKEFVVQIAEAVEHLHAVHGLVHGDLKCENVLVSNERTALLADFGLSTLVDKVEMNTRTGTAIRSRYTAAFAAPELFASDTAYSEVPSKTTQSDVYAFGMFILQVFTGERPWIGYNEQAIILTVSSGNVPPHPGERAVNLGLSDAWWNVCLDTWQYDPGLRPDMRSIFAELAVEPRALRLMFGRSDSMQADRRRIPLRVHSLARFFVASLLKRAHDDQTVDLRTQLQGGLSNLETHPQLLIMRMLWVRNMALFCLHKVPDDPRRLERAITQLRLLQDSIDYRSSQHAESMPTLSAVLGTSDFDTYETFPFHMHGHGCAVSAVAFISRTYLVSGSWDSSLRVWNARTGRSLREPWTGHAGAVNCVAVSPDGTQVASGSNDCTIRIRRLSADKFLADELIIYTGDMRAVLSLAFSPDGMHVVSGCRDGSVRVWDAATGLQVGQTLRHPHRRAVRSVAVCPDGARIASGADDWKVGLWVGAEGSYTPAGLLEGHQAWVFAVAFSPDGRRLASGSRDSTIRLWDVDSREVLLVLVGHTAGVTSVAFAPTARHLASASRDRTVRIWDVDTGNAVCVLRGHSEWDICMTITDGRFQDTGLAQTREEDCRSLTGYNPDGTREIYPGKSACQGTARGPQAAAGMYIWAVSTRGQPWRRGNQGEREHATACSFIEEWSFQR